MADDDDFNWDEDAGDDDGFGDDTGFDEDDTGFGDDGDDNFYADGDEGGDGDESLEPEVEVENAYYAAKDTAEDDAAAAIAEFKKVADDEKANLQPGKWGFKSLKRVCKLQHTLGKHDELLGTFERLLTYTKSAVTMNESEKALNSLLDFVADAPNITTLYDMTLDAFREKNEKACLRLELKLAKVLFARRDFDALNKTLARLHATCKLADGADDPAKGSQLMEIYAFKIQVATELDQPKELKQLYTRALKIKAAIPAPRTQGIIRECGGKMWMRAKQWQKAYEDFFDAFKNYDEAGSPRRLACLKYLVLASMLMGSDINPFEETRAKSYKSNDEIVGMISVLDAYDRQDIKDFERLLKKHKRSIMDDAFIKDYIDDLLRNMRTQVLLKRLQPYTRIRIAFISAELNVPAEDVEELLVSLILDNKIRGRIDQINGVLELDSAKSAEYWHYNAVQQWAERLSQINGALAQRV
eukprot:CAMPEP_0198311292 /NCGR_PEP_ID=MMETSP1450-20131203/3058_1 /TAXON_ID=753684 ORGANISM="Madagascaria erythrocladiodes, Strain CCMP3234" /NCGR_SAMPLE_ID=MMETSP1450 /ASSEMBLY_ACC=CAM_ASM_001115 /LENGTH=470 /DNA_ID=CAMNT_0044014163 /DNA_START=94 /DNA_END=1506 /DNA_ORIENTATION=+